MTKSIPLKDGAVTIPEHNVPEVGMNQAHYVKRARVSLVLYFERLTSCLHALPFIDPDHLPPFPHRDERGPQVEGTFFDHFTTPQDEAAVWAYAAEDFTTFGYKRYNPALPATAGDFLWIVEQ